MKNLFNLLKKDKALAGHSIKPFTLAQKTAIYNFNMKHNEGYLRSDKDGLVLQQLSN